MSVRPQILYPALFEDFFHHWTPATNLPDDNWVEANSSDSVFSMIEEVYLRATGAGELIYDGTSLDLLQTNIESTNANYLIHTRFVGKTNLKLSIIGRRNADGEGSQVTLDFKYNTIVFMGGGLSIADATREHTLTAGKTYDIELLIHDSTHIVLLNNAEIMRVTWAGGLTDHGCSIKVDRIPDDGEVRFTKFTVNELIEQPDPSMEDEVTNLVLSFRKQLQDYLEYPPALTMATFKEAYLGWSRGKDLGRTDREWLLLGYPIYEPATESWFVTTTNVPAPITVTWDGNVVAIAFDKTMLTGSFNSNNWFIRINNVQYNITLVGIFISPNMAITASATAIVNNGPDIISYLATNADIQTTSGILAPGFSDFPITDIS